MDDDADERLRAAAFAYLDGLRARTGAYVGRAELESFVFDGARLPLLASQRGIWKPSGLKAALSILTTYSRRPELRPYEDEPGPDGYLRYKWRGDDPRAFDNIGLREAMIRGKPLLWFWGVGPGLFDPIYPVWVVAEEPEAQQFVVALDAEMRGYWRPDLAAASEFDPVRRYAQTVVRVRLHQRIFRDRVLVAYESQCALCRLRHVPLLDAAHIREDSEGGEPVVPNGVAMCAIHHRAFDAQVLGLRPDYRIEIRHDVLEEHDGPTLQHALQGLHGERILLPRRLAERPNTIWLEERYERFRTAS